LTIYKNSLENLGYKLQDCGNHWRTNALYRNGKNKTAIIIYKDTGVWKDYGGENESKPFQSLIQETLKTTDPKILKKYLPDINENYKPSPKEEKIEMEKIYPISYLDKLLPMRTFYLNKNISEETQKLFQCGYAGGGKMYRRIVFPIFDFDNQIHGFSGRTVVDENNAPKWKHMGRKTNWVYPHHLSHKYIEESNEVILVESIGDCMALYEAGFKNVLMLAGLDISSKVMSYLNTFNLDKIIVAMNNDKDKETNSGGIATIKTVAKLSQIYDLNQICVNPPLKNDFGDMLQCDPSCSHIFAKWNTRKCKWNLADPKTQDWIIQQIKSLDALRKNANCKKLIKILNS
jgi:hypothetical protein